MPRDILKPLVNRQTLATPDLTAFIDAIARDEISDPVISAFLMGLLTKGLQASEAAALVLAMRCYASALPRPHRTGLLDTCGTGGGASTFNISSASAIVCAAVGATVAKHGSRSLFSASGSSDVLEALGVCIELSPQATVQVLDEVGITYLHGPRFNPVMARILPLEQALGMKALFYSLIGPLINPLPIAHHLFGVYRPDWLALAAQTLALLGERQALVVHGSDGVDEISPLGATAVAELRGGQRRAYTVRPQDFGLAPCRAQDVANLGPQGNAALIRQVFAGCPGPARTAVLLNSAGGLLAADRVASLGEGVALAAELLDDGSAAGLLARWAEASQAHAPGRSPFVPRPRPARSGARIWQGILQGAAGGMLLLDREGMVEQANDEACAQLGRTPAQVLGHAYAQLLGPALAPVRMAHITRAMERGRALHWVDSLAPRSYAMAAIPIDDGTGAVLYCRDRSEEARAEASEQDKRARLQTLIETLPDLICLTDIEGRVLDCNANFAHFLGIPLAALRGQLLSDKLAPQEAAQVEAALHRQVVEQQTTVRTRQWVNDAQGHEVFVDLTLAPFVRNGELVGVMGVARDMTQFQRALEEIERRKEDLHHMVYADAVTGLPSRQAALERVEGLARTGTRFGLMSIHLHDYSAQVSSFGISMADAMVRTAAGVIEAALPGSELFQTGESRFALVLPQAAGKEQLDAAAQRVITAMSTPPAGGRRPHLRERRHQCLPLSRARP